MASASRYTSVSFPAIIACIVITIYCFSALATTALLIDPNVIVSVDPQDQLVNTTVFDVPASRPFEVTGLTNGPDLDLGWNDYLDLRLRVPRAFKGDVALQFGTSTRPGFGNERAIGVPAAMLKKDGNWHTYRLDLSLVVLWRDRLSDLRFAPEFEPGNINIQKVAVGDIPNDVYQINRDINTYKDKGETLDDCSYMESKHAVTWWSPLSFSNHPNFNPAVEARRALRMIEEAYQVYCKKLGYTEPFEDTTGKRPGRFKVNHTTWYDGFWMGAQNGFAYFNVGAGGLKDEGWGNPVPHEFGHVIQGHQTGMLVGGHWESHVNFMRNYRNLHYRALFGDGRGTDIGPGMILLSNYRQDHSRLIYADYRIHMALNDFSAQLGLTNLLVKLCNVEPKDDTVYNKIAAALPPNADLADVVANGMRHWPFIDFQDSDVYKKALWGNPDDKAAFNHRIGAMLIPSQDKPGWWRCPFERSPEKFAFMVHDLVPASSNITVSLRGFNLVAADADWRWSLIAQTDDGSLRYSDIFKPGTSSFQLKPGETKVSLVVVATPENTSLDLSSLDNTKPVDKHIDRLRYPYEVKLTGVVPAVESRRYDAGLGAGTPHENGGGFVAESAQVADSAYVGPNARVLGNAKISDSVRIEDYAVVQDNAVIKDSAMVSGYALVAGNSEISGSARVRGRAVVENSKILDSAIAEGYCQVQGTTVKDNAIVRGCSHPFGGEITGTAISDLDYSMDFNLHDGVYFSHVPWGGWYNDYYIATQKKPRGLVASYRIEEPRGDVCWDEFGAQHAVLRGEPKRVFDKNMNSPVLRLNGSNQYMVVDRNVCDFPQSTISLWCRPADTRAMPLVFLGTSDNQYLRLDISSNGTVVCSLADGAESVKNLVSAKALVPGSWSQVALTLDGSNAILYINGSQQAQAPVRIVPADVLSPGDFTRPDALYVGRDWSGNLFRGYLEDIRFYTIALAQDAMRAEGLRCGSILGRFYAMQPFDFNSTNLTVESGVHNGRERLIAFDVKLRTSPDVDFYVPVVDSSDPRDHGRQGSGIGFDNGEIIVRLDKHGFWRTGVTVDCDTWHSIALTFDGSKSELTVDGKSRGTIDYQAADDDIAGQNYRIGYTTSGDKTFHLDGEVKQLVISDSVKGYPGLKKRKTS